MSGSVAVLMCLVAVATAQHWGPSWPAPPSNPIPAAPVQPSRPSPVPSYGGAPAQPAPPVYIPAPPANPPPPQNYYPAPPADPVPVYVPAAPPAYVPAAPPVYVPAAPPAYVPAAAPPAYVPYAPPAAVPAPDPRCDGAVYCTNRSGVAYPESDIHSWIAANQVDFRRLYDEVVLYTEPPAHRGQFPQENRGGQFCDYIEDFPLILWAHTVPQGWLPLVQTPICPQYFRLEYCSSETCDTSCINGQCGRVSSCRTFHNRVRVLAWDGEKVISTRVLLPDCCKCVLGDPAPAAADPAPYCDTCDPFDVPCLTICVERTYKPEPVYAKYTPKKTIYCDTCDPWDTDCLTVCVDRADSGNAGYGKKYCDKCATYDTQCLTDCIDRGAPSNEADCPCDEAVWGTWCSHNGFRCASAEERREIARGESSYKPAQPRASVRYP